jgi:Na+/H+ antiporter NhaD/arsenite permease-like protein
MHSLNPETMIMGLDPVLFASTLFILTYLAIMTERLNRAIIALLAAGIMILSGVLNQGAAIEGIDFNTLGLLTGMMIIVTITRRCGIFQFLAIWSAKKVNAHPWGILVVLVLVTAVLSALLDNVTTVLLIVPVTLLITDTLKVSPYPYLFAEIFASNVGGAATLIGDPPNIMIGSATGLSFNAFLYNLAPLSLILIPMMLLPIYLIWGRKLHASEELRMKVMQYREMEAITDTRLLKQSLGVLLLVMIGFVFSHHINQQPATIAMAGAALLLMLDNLPRNSADQSRQVHKTFSEIEWTTIFFFIGLFIAVHGLEQAGVLDIIAQELLDMTGNDIQIATFSILWVSAIASALVDNIPFVATMIPLIQSMGPSLGGEEALETVWWALAIGSCLGGNGSLVGASANLIVAGFAERSGQPIRFLPFMLLAFPMMLFSILISSVYVYFRYF